MQIRAQSLCNRNGPTENMLVEHNHVEARGREGGREGKDRRFIY